MKYIFLFISLCTALSLTAQHDGAEGIEFEDSNWAEANSTAIEANKLLFLEAFTSWCGPCKKMAREVFPDTQVGKFFNENFVNVSMNMEKGEGIKLAEKYKVMAYPTMIFVNPKDGSVVHRATGFHSKEEIIDLGKAALDPNRQLKVLEDRFAKGERNPDFLYNYAAVRLDLADDSYGTVADEYLKTQPNWGEEKNIRFLYRYLNSIDSKSFDYLIQNRERFEKMYTPASVGTKIEGLVLKKIEQTKDTNLTQVDVIFAKIYGQDAPRQADRFRMTYYRENEKLDAFADAATKYFKKYKSVSADELSNAAYTIYEVSDKKSYLKKALKWAETAVKLEPNYTNLETQTALLYKLGKKSAAIKSANQAIETARKNGDSFESINELLDLIKKL